MGEQLRTLMALPTLEWPADLFADADKLVAVQPLTQQRSGKVEDLCTCGCLQQHKQRVTQTVHSAHGAGWHVLYFASNSCKSKWNKARVHG
jgi:hypothetical protein